MEIEKGCSENTIRSYKHDLISFTRYLKTINFMGNNRNTEWQSVKILHVRGFLGDLKKNRNNQSSSIHRRVCSLKGFFGFLQENKEIEENPATNISYPKRRKSLPKFLHTDELNNLLNKAKTKAISKNNSILHRAVIEVLYSTGARCNEIRNMDLLDVKIETNELISKTGTKSFERRGQIMIRGGKGSKDRIVLLTNRAAHILLNYIQEERELTLKNVRERGKIITNDANKAVFVSNRGKRLANRTIQHFVSKISEEAGVRHTTPHMIRHSFASHLVMNKASIKVIQQLLGHSSLDTTQIYANITPEFLISEFEGNLAFK